MNKRIFLLIALSVALRTEAQGLYFPPTSGTTWETTDPATLNWCPERIDSLYAYLDTNHTKAFILLKDGKIVLEKYFGSHTMNTPWQWASAGKTITSFVVGVAQQENLLSIGDMTSDYLGQGWTNCTQTQEDAITIRHQLTMSSGLDDGVADPTCTLNNCLDYLADPNTRWAYHNAPYTLLSEVIESASGMTFNDYVTSRLKTPTGMTGTFVNSGYNKVFFSNARSMARFGLLILNQGNWNGNQLLTDATYFNDMVNTSQNLNESYGYLWWLNGKPGFMLPSIQFTFPGSICPNAPSDMIAGMGADGQFVNVIPSQNMVWIRMGESPDNLPVPYLLNDGIWEYINLLECDPAGVQESTAANITMAPNPVKELLEIRSDQWINEIQLSDASGRILEQVPVNANTLNWSFSKYPQGMYFIQVQLENETQVIRVIKE